MRRQQCTLVAFIYTSLVYSMCVHCLDQAEFSLKLRQEAENIIGINEFQDYLKPHTNQNLEFTVSAPNGMDHVQWIASEISRHVTDRANGVKRLKDAIIQSFTASKSTVMPKCCPSDSLGLQQDPRFPVNATTRTGCLFGKAPPTENGEPVLKGISDDLLVAMKTNLRTIPGVKWQYFGNTDGVMFSYPAKSSCHRLTYDPRLRPWYSFTATNPKDIIVMIDKSSSMTTQTYLSSGEKKLSVAIKAAQLAINSLNPNDNVGVLAFDDEVQLPSSSDECYRRQLALATKANKKLLANFVSQLPPRSTQRANYSRAFQRAFQLFSATASTSESTTMKKVILLLANGDPADTLSAITRSIDAGNRLIGTKVTILSFGMDTDAQEDNVLRNISGQTGGQHHSLNDPDTEKIKLRIGVYYNYFAKISDNNDVVFTVPYNDSGGLGMVTSACLPIVADSEFQGVTCMDIPIDTMFSPIIDFHLGRLSYAFLIDSRGRVLLHPLLPKPENYKHEPIFLDMESVEISDATGSVKASMISGTTGNMTVTDLRLFSSRGYSLHDGVTRYVGKAAYYWSPISVMNASVGLVIVDGEKNVSVSWIGAYPQILLTDELRLHDTDEKCNNFGRIASTDNSVVKLSPKCFVEPYNYTQQVITADMLQQFKNYLRDETTQTSFTVTSGVRESVALTYELERIWKRSAPASSDHLGNYTLYRYVGTREGVYRVYPAIRVATKFDPTKRPWYRRAEAQKDRITLSTETYSNGYVTISLAKAYFDASDADANDVLGIVGADVPVSVIYNFLTTEFDPCKNPNVECFAIDRSGFVLAHQDFLSNPPSAQVHITTKEPKIAADMVDRNIMTRDSCVNYADITNQRFYMVELHGDRALTNGHAYAISDVDMFVVLKFKHLVGETGTCSCPPFTGDSDTVRCGTGSQCQCPCYTSTDYSYCNGRFTTNNTKTCYPPTLPIYLVDLSVEERSVVRSLPACPLSSYYCPLIAEMKLCATTGCCWKSGKCSTCPTDTTTGGEPQSCDTLCLGLAIGLSVGLVVVIAIVVVAVVAWRRRRRRQPGLGSWSTDTAVTSPNKTVIYVGSEDRSENPYSQVENAGNTQEMTDVYLHL